jgi:hypothetical protein
VELYIYPDIDLESLFSSHSIAQVVDDADEFFSAVSSLSENVGDVQSVDLDEFFECPSPNDTNNMAQPLVGSYWGSHLLSGACNVT